MIRSLLSKYRKWLGYEHEECSSSRLAVARSITSTQFYGDFFMRFLVFGWLIFQTYTYYLMSDRPSVLFSPINWFDHLFMPVFPHWMIWYLVIIFTVFVNFRLLQNGERKWERIFLGIVLLWINGIRWKYEFFSHVGHLLVLYHLLGIFIPRKKQVNDQELIPYAKAIQWLFAGILVTYTWSGLWKVIGIVYKSIFKPDQINWLHPLAMKLNAIVGYRDWDDQMGDLITYYDFSLFWQITFLLMLGLQLFSILGAIRVQLLPYIMLGNISFHLVNAWLIRIEFYLAPMILLVAFFPYFFFTKNENNYTLSQDSNRLYIKNYPNGEQSIYSGYYAFRQRLYDKRPLIGGVFYFPGISFLAKPFFKKNNTTNV